MECPPDDCPGYNYERVSELQNHFHDDATHRMRVQSDGVLSSSIRVCRILHKHMGKLALVITPNHKDLRIAKMYHFECPWPAAQAEIFMINVYKVSRRSCVSYFVYVI